MEMTVHPVTVRARLHEATLRITTGQDTIKQQSYDLFQAVYGTLLISRTIKRLF